MADKGTNQQRRPSEAAVSESDQRLQEGPDSAHADLHDLAADTRGASAGAVAPRPRGQQEDELREAGSESGTAEFFQRLTDFAELGTEDEGELDLEGPEEDQLGLNGPVGNATSQEGRSLVSARGAGGSRRTHKALGGESDPDEPEARPAVAPQPSGGSVRVRVRPRKRAASIELQELLELGLEVGLIEEYQSSCIFELLVRLTWDDFDELQGALDLCETRIQQVVVLAALSAHRSVSWLAAFATELSAQGDEEILRRCSWRHGASRPGEHCSIEELRLWYDPMSQFAVGSTPAYEAEPAEVWTLPKWLRGVPTPALGMAALAFEQSLRADFHPEQLPAEGANDLLTGALQLHGSAHPALDRWLVSLCARAQSRGGLVSARDAILQARNREATKG